MGTQEAPIRIVNFGGQVNVLSPLYLISSQHVILDGSGVEGLTYGIKISDPNGAATTGLYLRQMTGESGSLGYPLKNLEARYIEIVYETVKGLQAVSVKNDDNADPNIPAQDLHLHHMYIHRTKNGAEFGQYTEGFYIGNTKSNESRVPGLSNVKVHSNIVADSGADGIQVSAASGGCEVFGNVVLRDSRQRIESQNAGIIIGRNARCDVHDNLIVAGYGPGIFYQGMGEVDNLGGHIYNNTIVFSEESAEQINAALEPIYRSNWYQEPEDSRAGIVLNDARYNRFGEPVTTHNVYAYHNTIVRSTKAAIGFSNDWLARVNQFEVMNNFAIQSPAISSYYSQSHDNCHTSLISTEQFNYADLHIETSFLAPVSNAMGVFPGQLLGTSAAWKAGNDINGVARPTPPSCGAAQSAG